MAEIDFSYPGLVAAAGVDPVAVAERIASGSPGAIEGAGLRFRRAGQMAAADAGAAADRVVAGSFRNDGAAVFDAAASTARGSVLLADRSDRMEEVARVLLDVAAELTESITGVAAQVATLEADLRRIVGLHNAAQASAAGAAEVTHRYRAMAVDAVRATATRIRAIVDAYNAFLVNRVERLALLGYGAPRSGPGDQLPADRVDLAALLRYAGAAGATPDPGAATNAVVIGGGAAGGGAVAGPPGAAVGAAVAIILIIAAAIVAAASGAPDVPPPDHTQPSHDPDLAAEPSGTPARARPQDDEPTTRGLQRENESARTLAQAGYGVEQSPSVPGPKKPDFRIEGKIFDNIAPETDNARNIADRSTENVDKNQADRIVLNIADSNVEIEAVRGQLRDWPIPGLKEVIVIDKQNRISHLYP